MPHTFFLFDTARANEDNLEKASAMNNQVISLYRGRKEEVLTSIAPYIFSFPHSDEFRQFIMENGWGDSWGIFAVAEKNMEEIFQHFTKLVMVTTAGHEQVLFRFYDPRVLRTFLPTCSIEQLAEFFGPVEQFICEDKDPSIALHFSFDGRKLITVKTAADIAFKAGDSPDNTARPEEVVQQGKKPRRFFS